MKLFQAVNPCDLNKVEERLKNQEKQIKNWYKNFKELLDLKNGESGKRRNSKVSKETEEGYLKNSKPNCVVVPNTENRVDFDSNHYIKELNLV